MEHGDFYADVEQAVEAVVGKYLVVAEQFDEPSGEEALGLVKFAEELLQMCHIRGLSSNDHEEQEEEVAAGEKMRKAEAREFMDFFTPPWTGPLKHSCPAGCCGPTPCADRAVSIKKGTRLVLLVICPHMTRPAANRYTKVFPVVCRVTLQLHFYTLFKKVMRMLLRGTTDNSDDDRVLHDVNAMLGAPVDAIAHHRKLQAEAIPD